MTPNSTQSSQSSKSMTLKQRSNLYLGFAFLFLLISIASFYCNWQIVIPITMIILTNAYLITKLIFAAIISDATNPEDEMKKLFIYSKRVYTLFILFIVFGIFTYSFASIYNQTELWKAFPFPKGSSFDVIYFSYYNLSTLGSDGISVDTICLKQIMMLQIFSSINLLLGSLSFLISRITSF